MGKIKVGNYIRTKEGEIVKVTAIIKDLFILLDKAIKFKINNHYVRYSTLDIEDEINFIVKYSPNIIDLIEDEDIAVLEYKSPKYRKRITRRFEISKIDNDIRFENAHCSFLCKVGDKKIKDKICKNIKIKSIVTREQFRKCEYRLEE